MRRRNFLAAAAAVSVAAAQPAVPRKGRLKQSAMRVNFDPKMPFEDVCREAARLGAKGMDLIPIQDWPTLRKYGLIPTMGPTGGVTFESGLIRKELHDGLEKSMSAALDDCSKNGCPNMITVGGQRKGMSYEEGADHAAALLNRVKARAEDKGVTICLEVMNNKFDDPALGRTDQICNHLAWGVDVCKRVNSPRVKLLCDIYHVQIMDGDVCHNIQQNFQWIGHFHTGGVPGRHEIDDTQEINYRFVAKTIADLGFTGYIAHEYRPTPGRDPIQDFAQAIEIMDV
ncbi:MAG: hydroxypyruvate isomerase [Terriglobia bacterium]|nr:MAG: hydroxypyruvate isomerase [Terriglobia bacterium]